MNACLAGPLVKLERAKTHIAALEAELQTFFATKPYVIGTKRNPQTRQLVYYMVSVGETSAAVAAIAGDALHSNAYVVLSITPPTNSFSRGLARPVRFRMCTFQSPTPSLSTKIRSLDS